MSIGRDDIYGLNCGPYRSYGVVEQYPLPPEPLTHRTQDRIDRATQGLLVDQVEQLRGKVKDLEGIVERLQADNAKLRSDAEDHLAATWMDRAKR